MALEIESAGLAVVTGLAGLAMDWKVTELAAVAIEMALSKLEMEMAIFYFLQSQWTPGNWVCPVNHPRKGQGQVPPQWSARKTSAMDR